MKFKLRRQIEKGMSLDVTPLLNVFFLLLIFFIFTSSFIFQPGIKVDLPKAITREILPQEKTVIVITESDIIYLNDRPITKEELSSNLGILAREKTPLLIKADKDSSLGKIVEVLDLCRAEGVSKINIATSQ